jgi:hypothetical protein
MKIILIPNLFWPRPQSRGHERSFPKVTSRGGLSEKRDDAQYSEISQESEREGCGCY